MFVLLFWPPFLPDHLFCSLVLPALFLYSLVYFFASKSGKSRTSVMASMLSSSTLLRLQSSVLLDVTTLRLGDRLSLPRPFLSCVMSLRLRIESTIPLRTAGSILCSGYRRCMSPRFHRASFFLLATPHSESCRNRHERIDHHAHSVPARKSLNAKEDEGQEQE